jgi:hypothetical protein
MAANRSRSDISDAAALMADRTSRRQELGNVTIVTARVRRGAYPCDLLAGCSRAKEQWETTMMNLINRRLTDNWNNELNNVDLDSVSGGSMTASGPELMGIAGVQFIDKVLQCFGNVGYLMGTPSAMSKGGPCPH